MVPWRKTLRRLDGAYSDHTLRSYRSDFGAFLRWCRKKRLKALPAASTTIVAYIDAEGARLKPSTVKRRLCALRRIHNLCDLGDPRFSYRGEDVVQTLERVCQEVGYPKMIRVDNGSEFISRDLDLWAYQRDVVLDFSRPGKPTDNAYIESFNGKFRAECLNQHWFLSLDDARQKMEKWRRDYNEVRAHSATGNKPPISLMNAYGASGPP